MAQETHPSYDSNAKGSRTLQHSQKDRRVQGTHTGMSVQQKIVWGAEVRNSALKWSRAELCNRAKRTDACRALTQV